ncbi:hypothetical protein J3S85_17260 [Streptomyces lavenduligriseus]|nr:hypothetical protein J3S85_17260 [Streptomyces lavenduligriseus]
MGHGAGDVDLGNRRITVGGHVRPLDDLTHRAVLDRLDHRRSRWPNTANPHLLITRKTAVELGAGTAGTGSRALDWALAKRTWPGARSLEE